MDDLQTNHFSVPENLAGNCIGSIWSRALYHTCCRFLLFCTLRSPWALPDWYLYREASLAYSLWEQRASQPGCKPDCFLQPFKVVQQVVVFLPKGRQSSAPGFLLTSRLTRNWVMLNVLWVLSKAERYILGYQTFAIYHYPSAAPWETGGMLNRKTNFSTFSPAVSLLTEAGVPWSYHDLLMLKLLLAT